VRVVLDASWPMDQVRPWIEGLTAVAGEGHLVIELVGLDAAEQPAAAMALGLPIATIDGEPATAQRWSDVLVARMLDEEPMRTVAARPVSTTSPATQPVSAPSKHSSRPAGSSRLQLRPAPDSTASDSRVDRVGAM
jgi:hypothetical protein